MNPLWLKPQCNNSLRDCKAQLCWFLPGFESFQPIQKICVIVFWGWPVWTMTRTRCSSSCRSLLQLSELGGSQRRAGSCRWPGSPSLCEPSWPWAEQILDAIWVYLLWPTSVPESILLPWQAWMKKSLGFPARLGDLEMIIVIMENMTFTHLSAVKGSHILWAG